MAATTIRTATTLECAGSCGGRCGGEQVTVSYGYDRRTGRGTVTYQPCTVLLGQGWTGHADVKWLPEPVVTTVRHRDGLVAFAV